MNTKAAVLAAVADLPKDSVQYFARWDDPRIAGRGTFAPAFVMVHGTAGSDSYAGLATGAYGDHRPVPGANFLVRRDGVVKVLTHRMAYHAGKGGPFRGVAAGMMNPRSWGVEFETWQRVQDLTPAQITNGSILIAGLMRESKMAADRLIQHKDWAPRNKPNDTLYSTEWWRGRVADARALMEARKAAAKVATTTVTKPGAVLKHSGTIGKTNPYFKTPVTAPVPVAGDGKWYNIATIDLPPGEYIVTLQVRMPSGGLEDAEVELVRLGWPGLGKEDSTGHNPVPRAKRLYGVWRRWRTPIEHSLSGGGKVAARILMPPSVTPSDMRFVYKAKRIA